MLDAGFSQLYFGPILNTLQRVLPAIAGLLVIRLRGSRTPQLAISYNLATPLSYTNFTSQSQKYYNTRAHTTPTHTSPTRISKITMERAFS